MSARRRCIQGHRFPAEIIAHCVWLYHRFSLSLREVQEMMANAGERLLRRHPPVVPQVWADLRHWLALAPAMPRGQVAPQRGVHQDQEQDPLPVAGGGSRGHPCWTFWSPPCRDAQATVRFFRKLLTGLEYVPGYWSPTNWPAIGWPTGG
jgi:hypothetical protein